MLVLIALGGGSMKKISSLLFLCLMCFILCAPCFAEEFKNPPIVDETGVLSSTQIKELSKNIEEVRKKYGFDVAVYIEAKMRSYDEMESADDIYDYYGYGAGENDDGILLYICVDSKKYWITTYADGERIFNENGIKYLEKNIKPKLKDGNYYTAIETFTNLSHELLEMAENGEPFNEKQYTLGYILTVIGCGLIIPLIIAFALMYMKLSKMKTSVKNDYAANYIKPGSMNIAVSRDIFLYSHIIKTERPKNNTSGSHTSSSGRRHGGGGGSF